MPAVPHQQLVAALRLAIARSGPSSGGEHPCSYLPGRTACDLAFRIDDLAPGLYGALMDLNFRRSGRIAYRPECGDCQECRAIRVPVADFLPDRTQRRCWQRNQKLTVEVGPPTLTDEKYALYRKYLHLRHDRQMDDSYLSLEAFLYDSPVETREVVYRQGERLVGVGIMDVEPLALSTVYCYYDPDFAAASPGTFNVLWTIAHARGQGVPFVYLGFYIRDCTKMNYKLNFHPCELFNPDGTWERIARFPQ